MYSKNIFILLLGVIFLAGCSASTGKDSSTAALSYLSGLAEKDKAAVIQNSCKTWEEQANLEVDALLSVGAKLNNVSCKKIGNEGDFELVNCTGALDLTYNDEIRSIDLSPRTYVMAMEGNSWRVCSYR
jgi:hypothetical protein